MQNKPKMLMHICCAVCAAHPYQILSGEYDITFYYYNPNIHPEGEYQKRLESVQKLAHQYKIPLIIGPYQTQLWFEFTAGLELEKEGGARCLKCYEFRLKQTAQQAKKLGFSCYCTTLSVSPHKNAQAINILGSAQGREQGIDFYQSDFKKKDGFKKTILLSKQLKLYRQNYCGCIYSQR